MASRRPSPVDEDAPLVPIIPYGRSKLMVEWMLEDAAAAHDLRYVVLRYFNVAGADPKGRSGQSTPNATHLIKVAVQAALGTRPVIEVFGTDYPTRDGSCMRDYIQVTDLVDAHIDRARLSARGRRKPHLQLRLRARRIGARGRRGREASSGVDFQVGLSGRRPGDPAVDRRRAKRAKAVLGWTPKHDDLPTIVRQALDWERRLHNKEL